MRTDDPYCFKITVAQVSGPDTTLSKEALKALRTSFVGKDIVGIDGKLYRANILGFTLIERGFDATIEVVAAPEREQAPAEARNKKLKALGRRDPVSTTNQMIYPAPNNKGTD